jgi:hypothetical protein
MADDLYWFVKVGDKYVNFNQFDMYVKHCFKDHEDDIMGWDLLRGCLHDLVHKTSDDHEWSSEDDEALDKMVDHLLSCPVCGKVPMYNSKWYCTKCQRQMTLKDVVAAMNKLKKDTGVQHCLRWE